MNGIYTIFYKNEKKPYIFQDEKKGKQTELFFLHKEEAEKLAKKCGTCFSVRIYLK